MKKDKEGQIKELFQIGDELRAQEIASKLDLSRVSILKVLNNLVQEGRLDKIGKGRGTRYRLTKTPQEINQTWVDLKGINLDEDDFFKKLFSGWREFMIKDAFEILRYVFTEMVNNVLDHSQSSILKIKARITRGVIVLEVEDTGLGVFETLRRSLNLESHQIALPYLFQGKRTRDPDLHTGQGIYFSSKVCGCFEIESAKINIVLDNRGEIMGDFSQKTLKQPRIGTLIRAEIDLQPKRSLQEVFNYYAKADEEEGFYHSQNIVKLYEYGTEFISRAEAQKLLNGLDKFTKITLDFQKVEQVGQGFCDEIFRVWANKNPQIEIVYKNAIPDVEVMIFRSKFKND